MKGMLLSGVAALVLLAAPAAAQDNQPKTDASKSVDPHQLAVNLKKPPLKLDDKQRATIQNVLVMHHTQQKTPKDFQPQAGATLPKGIRVDGLPQEVGRQIPEMKDYGYAKTMRDILVIDPMNMKIVAVIPRKFPNASNEKSPTPADWADKHAQELTGQAPQSDAHEGEAAQSGEAAAVGNGQAPNAQPQESGLHPGYQNQH
jgi:hypothetical protein